MSNESAQVDQRRANLAAIEALGFPGVSACLRHDTHRRPAGRRARRCRRRGARGHADRDHGRRARAQHPQLRQGELSGAVRRPRPPAGLRAAGCADRAGVRPGQAARLRRPRRRVGVSLPDQDQRAVDLGDVAHVPGEMFPAVAREVARPAGRRDALPPALPRSDRESGRAPRVRTAQPRRCRRFARRSRRAASSKWRRR